MTSVTTKTSKWTAYPAHEPSGIKWLGDIPQHWKMSRVKHIARFTTGWTPPTSQDEYYIGANPWATIADLGPRFLADPKDRISDDAIASSRMRISPKGSLLFSFKLSIGQVSIADTDLYTNEAIATFPPDNGTDISYLYWAAPLFIPMNADENIYGAKLLGQETIKNAKFAVPPLDEQRAIASFLDRETARIDSLIEKKHRQIKLLQEKRSALISHAVTKGLDPNVKMKDSGVQWLGDIPAHWSMLQLRRVVDKFVDYRGKTPEKTDSGIPLITAGAVKDGHIDHSLVPEFIADDDYEEWMSRGKPKEGDVVITTEAPLGEVAQVSDSNVAFAQRIILFKVNNAKMIQAFLRYYYLSVNGRSELLSRASGSTASGIRADRLKMSIVNVPPLNEQHEIVEYLEDALKTLMSPRALINESIGKLREYRTALISAAVTGKIDVRKEVA